jgi:hypothetical protein
MTMQTDETPTDVTTNQDVAVATGCEGAHIHDTHAPQPSNGYVEQTTHQRVGRVIASPDAAVCRP